jgi:hypothetical protein
VNDKFVHVVGTIVSLTGLWTVATNLYSELKRGLQRRRGTILDSRDGNITVASSTENESSVGYHPPTRPPSSPIRTWNRGFLRGHDGGIHVGDSPPLRRQQGSRQSHHPGGDIGTSGRAQPEQHRVRSFPAGGNHQKESDEPFFPLPDLRSALGPCQ